MNLDVFGQMSFLSETFATQFAIEWFLPSMSSQMNVNAVFVFKPFTAHGTKVQQSSLGGRFFYGPSFRVFPLFAFGIAFLFRGSGRRRGGRQFVERIVEIRKLLGSLRRILVGRSVHTDSIATADLRLRRR